jgi:hypothetical protein
MALDDVNVSMPVTPAYGNGGFGGFGSDWSWIIILLLFGMFGGWGGNGSFGGNNNLYPWLLNNNTQNGFDNAALGAQLSGIQNSINNGFSTAEISACGRAADSLNRSFDSQTAITNALYGVNSSLQNCCCENRANIADLKYTVAREACDDRNAVNNALRDVIAANTASTQRILDQMCADRISQKDDTIAQLRQELLYARGQASQGAQTAAIIANNEAQTTALEQYLAPVPKPAFLVQNPNCCAQNYGCGCNVA